MRFGLLRRRRKTRDAADFRSASRRIRQHLDSEKVIAASVAEIERLGFPAAEFWLTAGGDRPRLARATRPDAVGGNEDVARCAREARAIVARDSILVPVVAPRSGFVAIIRAATRVEGPTLETLEGVAAEIGLALETANLYEKALAEKEKSEAILARVGDAVVVTDPRGQILQWNNAAEMIIGSGGVQAVGRSCADMLRLRFGERVVDCTRGCPLLEQAGDGGFLDEEVWRPRPDGRRQPLLASASAVRDPDGHVSEIVHSLRDITRLKEADEAKTMFLATASHELKTPLTVIQGFAQTLQMQKEWDVEERARALDAMARRAQELNKIVDRLLLSSRIEAGRTQLYPAAGDLVPILNERIQGFTAATSRDIGVEMPDEVPNVLIDSDAVTTVVDHLLDNAVKYSPGGEPILVRVTVGPAAVRIAVVDQGIGMDIDAVARCFDKFWQAESSDVRRFGGTGIGLFIVRSLVEAMSGTVDLESAPDIGSTFSFTVPRADVVAQRAIRPAALPEQQRFPSEPSVIREFMRQIGVPTRGGR